MKKDEFVLFTSNNDYVVEYLFNELALSKSITEAKTFINMELALDFKKILFSELKLNCSVNTYIE